MKKALILLLILVVPALMSAQTTGLTSLEYDFSQGLFPNELDAALNVGPAFLTLNQFYLYGGVGNLNKGRTIQYQTASAGAPIWLGMFMPETRPYSLFLGSYFDGPAAANRTTTTLTQAGPGQIPTVSTTTEDVSYPWVTDEEVNTYRVPVYQQLVQQVQYLTIFGNMNLGLFLGINLIDNTNAVNNYTQTTSNYDNNEALTAIPVRELDFTENSEYRNRMNGAVHGINNTIEIKIPFFMETGGTRQHTAVFGASYNWTDGSQGSSGAGNPITYSLAGVPAFDTGGFGLTYTEVVADLETRQMSDLGIGLDYDLALPGLFNCNPENRFTTGVSASMNLLGGNFQAEEITQDHDYTAGGSVFTKTTRAEDIEEYDIAATLNFAAQLRANHSFFYQLPGMAEFGIKPSLSAGYSSTQTNPNLTSRTQTTRTDGDGDGLFNNAIDTIDVTTLTYEETTIAPNGTLGNKVRTNVLTIATSIPSSLKIQPEKWWFGLIIGATPQCVATFSSLTTNTSVVMQRDNQTDGTGTVTGNDTVVNAESSNPSITQTNTFTVSLNHNIGAFFDFTENIHMSVNIAAAVSGGVWDFRNLVVQGIIRLPHTPKEQ